MSNLVFPATALGALIASKEPYQDVKWDEAASGKEVGSTWQLSPRWKYKIVFEVLNGIAGGRQDLQQMLMLFLRHCRGDSFLLSDPEDSSVTDMGFGVGDGATTAFQLQRMVPGLITDAEGVNWTPQTKPYANIIKNSSFEDNPSGGATSWNVYNQDSVFGNSEPAQMLSVPGRNGGKAQRVSWGKSNTGTKGVLQSSTGTKLAGQWYTIALFARHFGTVSAALSLAWNNQPSSTFFVSTPTLSTAWQLYIWQVRWNAGVTIDPDFFVGVTFGSAGFGDLEFDDVLMVPGQYDATSLPQPFSTPPSATGTRTPSYWPSQADGYEPIYELKGNPTLYQDGDWQGRRQLYPYTRTNLLAFSEQFDNAAWTTSALAMTVTANTTVAPDGTTTAETLNEGTTASSQHFVRQTIAALVGELRCVAVFLKTNTLGKVQVRVVGSNEGATFDLAAGTVFATVGGALASGIQSLPSWGAGWYRGWFVYRSTVTTGDVLVAGCDNAGVTSYTGTSRTFFAWGAMAEVVSNLLGPTPYVKTTTTSGNVTDYSMGALAKPTLATAPPAGAFLSADMSFYKRVRLAQAGLPLSRIVSQMWASGIDLISQRPLP